MTHVSVSSPGRSLENGRSKRLCVPPNAIIYNFGVRASNLEFRTRFEFLEETSSIVISQKLARIWSAEREIRDLKYYAYYEELKGRTYVMDEERNFFFFFQSFEIFNEFQFFLFQFENFLLKMLYLPLSRDCWETYLLQVEYNCTLVKVFDRIWRMIISSFHAFWKNEITRNLVKKLSIVLRYLWNEGYSHGGEISLGIVIKLKISAHVILHIK